MQAELGMYQDGPLVSRIIGTELGDPALPDGTLLYGQLWSGVVARGGFPAVMVRYSKATLPDGRTYPVCLVLADGRIPLDEGSKEGASILPRRYGVLAVRRWP